MTATFHLLLLHLLGAAIWTGGHLVLALGVLPAALRHRDAAAIQAFESRFERIGIPALLIQVVTGVMLLGRYFPEWSLILDWANPMARAGLLKLGLLALTLGLALDARLRIIPKLSKDNLTALAWHIIPVTIMSVAFVYIGLRFRFGGT